MYRPTLSESIAIYKCRRLQDVAAGKRARRYPVTRHSSQGATADRELVHVDTEQAHDQLVNSRRAYVSVSRGRYDAQIYTNDAQKLGQELVAAVSAYLPAGSSGKYAILRQGSDASMIGDVRRGKAHSQEFADCAYPLEAE